MTGTWGEVISLFSQCSRRIVTGRIRWKDVLNELYRIGVESLPIVVIATAFAGMVVTSEIAWHMNRALSSVAMIPGFTGQFVLRELGIAIPALLMVAKVGASITAEVGTMRVTDQIDALKLLKVDTIGYLVVPKIVASMISLACLTIIAASVTLACAAAVACIRYGFTVSEYLNMLRHFVEYKDLGCALTKGAIFGAVIPVISCAYGFRCPGGAQGVGQATTDSVVASTMTVIVLDFILTYLFTLI